MGVKIYRGSSKVGGWEEKFTKWGWGICPQIRFEDRWEEIVSKNPELKSTSPPRSPSPSKERGKKLERGALAPLRHPKKRSLTTTAVRLLIFPK